MQQAAVVSVEAGLSRRISTLVALPLLSVDLTGREEISSSGFGDIEISARVAVTNPEVRGRISAVGYAGAAIQTGRDPDRSSLAVNAQLSRDVPGAIAGAELSLTAGETTEIYGRFETQIPIGDSRGYRFGATRSAALIVSSSIAGSKVRWLGGFTHRYAGRDEDDGDRVESRGGDQTRLVGGLVLSLTARQRLGVRAERLVLADLPGDQLVTRSEYLVGWRTTLGGAR